MRQRLNQGLASFHGLCTFLLPVLRLDMVEKSAGPGQTHYGRVFGDEAVQTGLLFPE
jgi:hypothetical protein